MNKYFKTRLTFEVLSRDEPYSYSGVKQFAYDIVDGDFSGALTGEKILQLTEKQIAKALIAQGSDPEWLIDLEESNDE